MIANVATSQNWGEKKKKKQIWLVLGPGLELFINQYVKIEITPVKYLPLSWVPTRYLPIHLKKWLQIEVSKSEVPLEEKVGQTSGPQIRVRVWRSVLQAPFVFWVLAVLVFVSLRCVSIDRLGDRISVAEKRRDESRRGQERQEHREVCWTLVCWSLAPCNRRWQGWQSRSFLEQHCLRSSFQQWRIWMASRKRQCRW